jgi:hypothetical protein
MEKLIDRLKPEYKLRLNKAIIDYPYTMDRTLKALQTEYLYSDLRFMDIINLCIYVAKEEDRQNTHLNTILFNDL